MNITVLRFETIGSTNTEALRQARLGADEGLCIVAREQTEGRGRQSRAWVSKKDAGLYFSIVLRPQLKMRFLPLITLMAGVAVHDTLAEIGLNPDIKWVNDLLIKDKKIAGILAETTETEKGVAVIVGIGINVTSMNSAMNGSTLIATSIEDEGGALPRKSPDQLLTQVLIKYLIHFYEMLGADKGPSLVLEEWRRRSTYFSGKTVRVKLESETLTGTTDGLEENGALRVRKNDGNVTIIQAGDVEQVRPAT